MYSQGLYWTLETSWNLLLCLAWWLWVACRFVNFVVPMEIIFTAFLVVVRKMEWDVRSVKFLSFYLS